MKKQIISSVLIIYMSVILNACTDQFEEINTNPNAPIAVQPGLLLRQVIYDYGEQMSYEGFVAGNLLSQHFAMVDFNLFDRHDLSSPQLGGNPWPVMYNNLRDNERLLQLAAESSVHAVYEGPALVMKAYISAALTDIYGDVPYSEALQGKSGNTTPVYDAQEQIYLGEEGILANLDRAIELLSNYDGNQRLEGDILYNGDLSNWVRFANSLKIKYLMRISSKMDVSSDLEEIYQGGMYIRNDEEAATFDFSDSQPNTFRMAVLRAGDFNLFVMSETMQEIIETLDDPRVNTYFRGAAKDPANYLGLLNGQDASATSISVSDYSLPGTIFRENTGSLDANFMTAWETAFLLAEAAEKGLITADPLSQYNLAVISSFRFWKVELPSDYLINSPAAYQFGGRDPIEQIITQKWLSGILNGYESWIEYRRTGFPRLKNISASLNNDRIPVRMPYPAEEEVLNAENYSKATSENGNSVNSPVWWDR